MNYGAPQNDLHLDGKRLICTMARHDTQGITAAAPETSTLP